MVESNKQLNKIIHIKPKAEELVSNKHIKCTETGCTAFFSNAAHLSMHLAKHHMSQEISAQYEADTLKLYFCPITECTYSEELKNGKHFTCLKYLRQHFQKVHMDKKFECSLCAKRFPTNSMKVAHELDCGQKFTCEQCGWSYKSRASLLLHARRKRHITSTVVASTDVEVKNDMTLESPIKDEEDAPSICTMQTQTDVSCNLLSKLLLDTCTQTQDTNAVNSTTVTLETIPVKPFVCNECGWKYQSREALLIHCRRKGHKNKVTSKRSTKQKAKREGSIGSIVVLDESNNFESKSIQTEMTNVICVPFEMLNENLKREQDYTPDDHDSGKRFKLQQSSNSFEFASAASTCEKGTSITFDIYNNVSKEDGDVPTSFEQFVISSSFCDIETQTEYPTNLLETVLYSDTHTQTCDDLLSEFGFNNIQTQTNWTENKSIDCDTTTDVQDINDILVSTETQTSFSQCLLNSTGVSAITQHTQTCETLLDGLFGERQTDLIAELQSTYTQT